MTEEERYNLQKNKKLPSRLKTASNNEDEAIDNYILSRRRLREQLKEKQEEEESIKIGQQIDKKLKKEIENIGKQIGGIIEI